MKLNKGICHVVCLLNKTDQNRLPLNSLFVIDHEEDSSQATSRHGVEFVRGLVERQNSTLLVPAVF